MQRCLSAEVLRVDLAAAAETDFSDALVAVLRRIRQHTSAFVGIRRRQIVAIRLLPVYTSVCVRVFVSVCRYSA